MLGQIVAKTDGIPLFVEELVKTILESGLMQEDAGRYVLTGPLPPLAIPATLQDALMARLDQLAVVKDVAPLGAVIGREFSYEMLRAVAPRDEVTLQQALAQLMEAELLYQRGLPPQVTYVFKHALIQLCQQVDEMPELGQVLYGLWRFYLARPQFHTAREIGETLLHLAQRAHDPALAVIAYYALGLTWLCLGALPAARTHLEEGIARYTPDQRRALVFRMNPDPGVNCRHYAAWTLWLLGYPAQALARLREALALAHELSHPYSLVHAWCMAAFVAQFRRDVLAVHEYAEAAIALATEQELPYWVARGTNLRGWELAMQGQGEAGMAQVRQGLTAWQATGAAQAVPYMCTLLAEVCDHLGHTEDGLQALAEAHTLVEQHEDRWWEAEIHRLQGVLLLRQRGTPQAESEACFQQALDVARRQQAKSLELRAAMSLSRLWQRQGKRDAAQQCWQRSTAGSPRGLTPPTSRRPRRCWRR